MPWKAERPGAEPRPVTLTQVFPLVLALLSDTGSSERFEYSAGVLNRRQNATS